MKVFLMYVAILAGAVGLLRAGQTPAAPRDTPSAAEEGSPKQRDAALTMEGEITRVDDQQNQFWLLMVDGREMQFSFAASTPVVGPSVDGSTTQGLRENRLEKGMHVKVEYDNVSGSNVVTKIEVRPAKT